MAKLLWTNRANFGPGARAASAISYDSTRNRVVLFGGDSHADLENGTPLGDTWEWDGSFWTQMDDVGPSPRSSPSMVYDTARKVSILFGGRGLELLLGDTWQWDATDWTLVSESGPSPRSGSAMAFDSARNRTVLFAGGSKENPHLSDTWEFDGEDWTQPTGQWSTAARSPRHAFDSVGNRVILFGGIDVNNDGLGDTWAWDGSEWVQIAEFGPPPRLNAALARIPGETHPVACDALPDKRPETAASPVCEVHPTWSP